MGKVLVIAPQFVGDSILGLAFLRELKKHYGKIEIDVLTKNAGLLIFSGCGYANKVYDMKSVNFPELRKNNYEKAYVLKRSFSAAVMAFLSGAKERIGFGGQFREFLLTKVVKYNKNEPKHESEHFFDVLKADYVEISDKLPSVNVNPAAKESVSKFLKGERRILIAACSSTHVKDWDINKFAEIVLWCKKHNLEVYFAGTEKEKETCDEIIRLTNSPEHVNNLCGKLSWDEIVALIDGMDIVFGVDTGFCHLGAALGKRVITLFGPTSVTQWKPLGNCSVITAQKPCSPCAKPKKCPHNFSCMKDISTDKVIEQLEKSL